MKVYISTHDIIHVIKNRRLLCNGAVGLSEPVINNKNNRIKINCKNCINIRKK